MKLDGSLTLERGGGTRRDRIRQREKATVKLDSDDERKGRVVDRAAGEIALEAKPTVDVFVSANDGVE